MELLESLVKGKEFWQFLADNPRLVWEDTAKIEAANAVGITTNCTCCSYANNFNEERCVNQCPLTGLWSKDDEYGSCTSSDSPYYKWNQAETLRAKRNYALQIVALINRRLEDFSYALNE